MNLSISDELKLQQHMSPHALEQLARDIRFVQRRSKYPSTRFSSSECLIKPKCSSYIIDQLYSRLETNTSISTSPEGLNQYQLK